MESTLLASLIYVVSAALVLWAAGAIFYDVGDASIVGAVLALAWLALASVTFILWEPLWKPFALLIIVLACFLRWWLSQQPSQDKNWDPHFARLASIDLLGDRITIKNVRNSEYRGIDDASPRYDTRELEDVVQWSVGSFDVRTPTIRQSAIVRRAQAAM